MVDIVNAVRVVEEVGSCYVDPPRRVGVDILFY